MPQVSLSPVMIAVVAIIAVFVIVAYLYARNYVKVPPNQVAIFTGRGKKTPVRGGARFRMPIIERVDIMDLEPFSVQVRVANVYSRDGVPVSVDGVGLIRFGSTDDAINTAVERFLTSDRRTIQTQVEEILAGNMRGIVAQMTVEELNGNRDQFTSRVLEEAGSAFARIGMELDVLTIQNISDANGYLDALGRGRIAEVKRDAKIREAEAERDAQIASAAAKREGDTAQAAADTAIAQANQERDLEFARIAARVDAERATAAQAGPRAEAEARKAVVVANAEARRADEEAQIAVEEMRSQRKEQAQRADVVIPAEAARQAAILEAEGRREAAIAQAQAEAEAKKLEGAALAEARTVAATAHRAELEAEAEGERAKLLAQAEGQQKLAEALNTFSEAAARLSVLPDLVRALPQMAEAIALPLGQIGNMVVMDGAGGNGAQSIGGLVPKLLAQTLVAAQAVGLDIPALLGAASSNKVNGSSIEPATGDKPTA
jgi:flotillin